MCVYACVRAYVRVCVCCAGVECVKVVAAVVLCEPILISLKM